MTIDETAERRTRERSTRRIDDYSVASARCSTPSTINIDIGLSCHLKRLRRYVCTCARLCTHYTIIYHYLSALMCDVRVAIRELRVDSDRITARRI